MVNGWNASVNAPSDWLMPLQVDSAVVAPGQPSLSRPSAQNDSSAMPCCDAYDSTVAASPSVKISPDVSFCPIIGVTPIME